MSFPRYPEYKDSGVPWLGAVPVDWNICALKRIVDLNSGESITAEDIEEDGEYPVFGGNGLRGFTASYTHEGTYALVGRQGALCGNINYATGKFWASEHAVVATPKVDVETHWLGELMRAMNLNQYSVSAAQPGLSVEIVGNLRIPVPPIHEQTAIATFLDSETAKIDALVAEQEKLIALLKEKRQAVISHAVTKGLDPSVSMKDSGVEWLGEVPAHWGVLRIKSLSTFLTSGPRGWSERVGDSGSVFVQSGDILESMRIDFENAKRVSVEGDAEAVRTRLADGDVVVCITGAKTGNVAVCATVPEDAYVNQHLCLIRPSADVIPEFLGVYLKSDAGQKQFSIAQYGLKQGLSLQNVKDTFVAMPPVEEQTRLVSKLRQAANQVNELIETAEDAIRLLCERKTSLISAAVTGQIMVTALQK